MLSRYGLDLPPKGDLPRFLISSSSHNYVYNARWLALVVSTLTTPRLRYGSQKFGVEHVGNNIVNAKLGYAGSGTDKYSGEIGLPTTLKCLCPFTPTKSAILSTSCRYFRRRFKNCVVWRDMYHICRYFLRALHEFHPLWDRGFCQKALLIPGSPGVITALHGVHLQ